jgi:MtN3 and saliva related transmembrane protein
MSNYQIGEVFGYISSGINTILFIPQVYHSFYATNLDSINYLYLGLEITGSFISITYGYFINEIPIIISNSSILICILIILFLKIKKRNNIKGYIEIIP